MFPNACVRLTYCPWPVTNDLSLLVSITPAHWQVPRNYKAQDEGASKPFYVAILLKNHPGTALKSPNHTEDSLDHPSNALR